MAIYTEPIGQEAGVASNEAFEYFDKHIAIAELYAAKGIETLCDENENLDENEVQLYACELWNGLSWCLKGLALTNADANPGQNGTKRARRRAGPYHSFFQPGPCLQMARTGSTIDLMGVACSTLLLHFLQDGETARSGIQTDILSDAMNWKYLQRRTLRHLRPLANPSKSGRGRMYHFAPAENELYAQEEEITFTYAGLATLAYLYLQRRIVAGEPVLALACADADRTGECALSPKDQLRQVRKSITSYLASSLSTEKSIEEDVVGGIIDFVYALQCPYTGGFAGHINGEAHAGYTYCAIATLKLLGHIDDGGRPLQNEQSTAGSRRNPDLLPLPLSACAERLERAKAWLLSLYDSESGGFAGRYGKPTDVCYSFWVAASLNLLGCDLSSLPMSEKAESFIFSCFSAKEHAFCKQPEKKEGLLATLMSDAPNRGPDPFHSCFARYALALFMNEGNRKHQRDAPDGATSPIFERVLPELAIPLYTASLHIVHSKDPETQTSEDCGA